MLSIWMECRLSLMVTLIFLLPMLAMSLGTGIDYWNDDYDEGKNCKAEDTIKQLKNKNKTKIQCVSNYEMDPQKSLALCKEDLVTNLLYACRSTQVSQGGKLLYCKNRGQTTCCFVEHKCSENWGTVNDDIVKKAEEYLIDKEETLKNYTKELGYLKCHSISGYDASECAEDCQKYLDKSNTPLAKECDKRNGMLKCCIRRDKFFCDECRYCCSLPFCTYLDSQQVSHQLAEVDLGQHIKTNQNNQFRGVDLIAAPNPFYKDADTRCLKPNSNEEPEKWDHYWPDDFTNAISEDLLEKARITKFDKRFFNFEDPDVFEEMLGANYKKNFKEVYGYDFVSKLGENYDQLKDSATADCAEECLKAEQSSFARECSRIGGMFKCCISTLHLEVFDFARVNLKEKGLISSASGKCGTEKNPVGNCILCTAAFYCTSRQSVTGALSQSYKTDTPNYLGGKAIKDVYKGKIQRIPFKVSMCNKQDFCKIQEELMDSQPFFNAESWEESCNITTSLVSHETSHQHHNFKEELKETFDQCRNRTSNIRICPKDLIKENKLLVKVNEKLSNVMLKAKNNIKKSKKKNEKKKRHKKKNMKKKKKKRKSKKKKKKKSQS